MRNERQCLIHASLPDSLSTTSPLVGEIVTVAFAFALLCFALLSDWILDSDGGIVFPGEISIRDEVWDRCMMNEGKHCVHIRVCVHDPRDGL